MAETKVTYLIGAGASANALPVVNGMNDRMEYFLKELYKYNDHYKLVNINKYFNLKYLFLKSKNHQTIDTYAKKLFLKNDSINYYLLKRFLSLFFIYEQMDTVNYDNPNIAIQNSVENYSSILNNNLDKRYDSMLASLLNKDRFIENKINFISWNYDMQFELSYSDFFYHKYDIDIIQDIFHVFPNNTNIKYDISMSSLIKLNGTGAFFNNNTQYFDIINDNFWDNNIMNNVFSILFDDNDIFNKQNQLKFSWENDEKVKQAREYAKEIIGNSDIIVIIGYSFPTFNRDIDREIFKKFDTRPKPGLKYGDGDRVNKYKKIYIQDTKDNAPKIKERLKAIGNNLFDIADIYTDLDQFLIPYEL